MTDEELIELITGLESDRVERKESLTADRIREAICAFANDLPSSGLPGVIAVGLNDDGEPVGLNVDDQLLLSLAHMRDDGKIVPFPEIEVRAVDVAGRRVAVVVVQPSLNPPLACDGRIRIRVGPRRAIATPNEEQRLVERRRFANLPFDSRPVRSATIDDLDLEFVRRELLPQVIDSGVLAENHRPLEQQVAALHLADPSGVPTATGLLLCGISPPDHVPGAYLQFLRFDGNDLSGPVKSTHRLVGPMPQIMREVDEILRANVETVVRFAGEEREVVRPTVPFEALQQLVRNALIHRNYEGTNAPVRVSWFDDRVEIQSPGGPFGQVTVESFGQPGLTDYRNPSLAGMLGQLGYVQRFGAGIPIAQAALSKNGNPPAEFIVNPTNVAAIVRFE